MAPTTPLTEMATAAGSLLALMVLTAVSDAAPPPEDPQSFGALYELLDERGRAFERLEASGIAFHHGELLVVDDTLNDIFVFDLKGRLRERLRSDRFPPRQAKFEELSFSTETARFFAVGSHSGRDIEELDRLSFLITFRLTEERLIRSDSVEYLPLRRSFERLGLWHPKGMKIEGLAVVSEDESAEGEWLYVGLREPSDRGRVYRVEREALSRSGGPTGDQLETAGSLAPPLPEKMWDFDPGEQDGTPYSVSALLWAPELGGLLVATSTEAEETHDFLGNRLFIARPGTDPELVRDRFDAGMKAEGLAAGDDKLFIVYDNDQDDTGIGSHLRVVPHSVLRTFIRTAQ